MLTWTSDLTFTQKHKIEECENSWTVLPEKENVLKVTIMCVNQDNTLTYCTPSRQDERWPFSPIYFSPFTNIADVGEFLASLQHCVLLGFIILWLVIDSFDLGGGHCLWSYSRMNKWLQSWAGRSPPLQLYSKHRQHGDHRGQRYPPLWALSHQPEPCRSPWTDLVIMYYLEAHCLSHVSWLK